MLPRLSIIVCTTDRPDALDRCLQSMQGQDGHVTEFEVLVIDNAPSASTREQVARYEGRQPAVRYIAEPVEGLSHARNRGALEARAPYLTYVDDDAVAPADFVGHLLAVIAAHQPDIVGGPVFPYYTTPPPAWFRDQYEIRQYAAATGFSDTCGVSGSNFTIRRDVLMALGGFDVRLGMKGTQQGFGEDRAMLVAYRRQTPAERQRVYYSLECRILHWVPPRKFRLGYMIRRQFDGGMMNVRIANRAATNAQAVTEFSRAPGAAARLLWRRWRRHGIFGTDYVDLLLTASFHLGVFAGIVRGLPARLTGAGSRAR